MLKKIFPVILAASILAGSWGAPETVYGQTLEKAGESNQEMIAETPKIAAKEVKKINVKLNVSKITLEKGKSKILRVRVAGTAKKVKWSSSDNSIATVSRSGKVTAKKAGTVKIRAKIGSVSAVCRVTVNQTLTKKQTEKAVHINI